MRVNLIRPKTDDVYSGLKQVYSSFPPSAGLCCLGSAIKDKSDVVISDGNLNRPQFNADIVGIQDWVTTHTEALRLARQAKEQNPRSIVVLGGINASHLANRILQNHGYVDYVVHGHGEEALLGLVLGDQLATIPNLCYRKDGVVKKNPGKVIRSRLFNLEQVVSWECDKETPFPIAGIRGCIKAATQGICRYCSLENESVGVMSPVDFWKQVRILKEKYGITYFFETGDEFNVGTYPQRLLHARPNDLSDVSFRIYSYPETLSQPGVIETLADLKVRELYMGVETINGDILRSAGRKYDAGVIEDIFEKFSQNGLRVMVPFMFGLPGETNQTAQDNFDFSQRLLEKFPYVIKMMQYSLVVPIAGSSYFALASTNKNVRDAYSRDGRSLDRDDTFDYGLLTELFIQSFSKSDIDFLRKLIERGKKRVQELGFKTSTFIGVEDRL